MLRRFADITDGLNLRCAAADSSYYQHMDACKSIQPLIVNNFMTTPVTTRNAVDLFENMVPRERRAATPFAL